MALILNNSDLPDTLSIYAVNASTGNGYGLAGVPVDIFYKYKYFTVSGVGAEAIYIDNPAGTQSITLNTKYNTADYSATKYIGIVAGPSTNSEMVITLSNN